MAADRPKVLIVEDDRLIVMCLAETLDMAGYEVTGSASNVAEALALAQRLRPDLAIFDIRLPGREDGIVGAGLLRLSIRVFVGYFRRGENPPQALIDRADDLQQRLDAIRTEIKELLGA